MVEGEKSDVGRERRRRMNREGEKCRGRGKGEKREKMVPKK